MFCDQLNHKRTQQFKQWLGNKSVIVVGNSIHLMNGAYGKLVDSYDVVVRLGKGIVDPTLYACLGTKTHVWFSGMFRAHLHHKVQCKWKILTISSRSVFENDNGFVAINKVLLDNNFQPYRDYFWADSIPDTAQHWSSLGFNKDVRPSQGLVCCDFLTRKVEHTNIHILGFDFFTHNMEFDGKKYTSWHLPEKAGAVQELAHDTELEKNTMQKLIRDYGIVHLPYYNWQKLEW